MTEPISVPLSAAEVALITLLITKAREAGVIQGRTATVARRLLEKLDHA